MNFYLKNKHLFEDEGPHLPSYPTRLDRLEDFLVKPRPVVPNFPKFSSYEREELPQPEPLKSVFRQNARNLLGNNYNDKYENQYDHSNYAGQRNIENRPTDRSAGYSKPPDDNVKSLISPLKANYSQDIKRNVGPSIRDIDRSRNPLADYDVNVRTAGVSSVPRQRSHTHNAPEERNSYVDPYEVENPYGYGGIMARNIIKNIPYEPYRKIELPPLRSENRGGRSSHSISVPYAPYRQQNMTLQPPERSSILQSDSHRTDRYNAPLRNSMIEQQPITASRNNINNDRSRDRSHDRSASENSSKKNSPVKQTEGRDKSIKERMSHTENGINILRTKEASTIKVTLRDPVAEERKDARFPFEDYQILKRKLGMKVDFSTSEKNSLRSTAKPQFLQNWQGRLDQLEMTRSRRVMTIPEALERRLLFAVNPERKERLKELLNNNETE